MPSGIWGIIGVSLALVSFAEAQVLHCKNLDANKPNDATRAFACVSKLSVDLEAALARMEALEEKAHTIPKIPRIPTDVVVAFADDSCPPGWSRYTKAHGRMIIGATENAEFISEYSKGSDGKQLPFKKFGEHGGQPTVTLTEAQMPEHKHSISVETWRDSLALGAPGTPVLVEKLNLAGRHAGSATLSVNAAGHGKPHENMPPYIALYFCKKD